jgi:3-oxoadipate enol-lactonase/4-carboxymuconolactone decarboxylase
MNDDERRERGMKIRRDVLGDEYVDRAQAATSPLTKDFQDLLTRYAWGDIWARPGLDRRTRSCITVAMTVALNRPDELALHLRGALRNGVTVAELREILLQTAVYCGIPAANTAFKVAEQILGAHPDLPPQAGEGSPD